MRRIIAIAAVGLALGQPGAVFAAEPAPKADNSKPGTNVEMPILVAPLSADGKLIAYAYVSSTLVASSAVAAIEIRDKTPFLQDAFIRDVNGAPIGQKDAPGKLDQDGLKARLLADARKVVGSAKVAAVQFTQVQVTPLRPDAAQEASGAP
jgi:hypothetical protein